MSGQVPAPKNKPNQLAMALAVTAVVVCAISVVLTAVASRPGTMISGIVLLVIALVLMGAAGVQVGRERERARHRNAA